MSSKGNNPGPPPGTKRPKPPAIPPLTPRQLEIRARIEDVKRRRSAIKEIVTCPECGCLIPVPAGGCYVRGNCGEQIGGC
jgi:hypothetical protein